MARTTNVYANKFAYLKEESAGAHETPNTTNWYSVKRISGKRRYFALGFSNISSSLRRYKIISSKLRVYANVSTAASVTYGKYFDISIYDYMAARDINSITYNSRPDYSAPTYYDSLYGSDQYFEGPKEVWIAENSNNRGEISPGSTVRLLANGGDLDASCGNNITDVSLKAVLADGTTRPYLQITYDESTIITSKVAYKSGPTSGSISSGAATTFSWDYVKNSDSDYCADETWAQKSATFYWKKSTESNYHSVAVSGNTKSVTIPANTFPTGSTIQWYVRGTDEDNTTTQTSVYSFSTYATQITPDTYPSGNSVDNRAAKSFIWHFASTGGNYAQQSATLYWRVQGASTWNTIAASGTTQSLSVPAYTFPAGSTIEWYLRGVDATGTASTSTTATFQTLAYTLAVTTAPSGSNVGTLNEISFAWTLANSQGAATQKSAVLYWRVQGAATYNAITNSTATKSISVPANTFPTGATIQWYLSVTAADNTVKSTSATTFTTVSPQVTPTIYPSGSNVYSGEDITIKWKLASSSGDYAQKSAVFYWRLTTSEEYRSISISGNTQQVTIPALTFPTNATVYWYLTAVDIGNHSSSTSVQNFKTSTTKITPQNSPTSGYTNPRNAITFSWYFAASGGSIPQGSASLYWRVQDQSSWTQVAASGSTTSVTIPANTFPVASEIQWYISGSDASGTSSQSSVYSFSTTASTAYAVVKSPVNSGVDGSKEITFQWTITTADGYAASRVILQWKLPTEDEQHWHTIIDTNNAITQYTVEGGTFQPGEINWRVQAYNVDSVAGPESTASFVCIIAPSITALTASNVPFSIIRWQANDQQGFQLEIDGVTYGPYSGSEKEFAVPDYFRDGVHTIRLRIIGTVDLWSEWEETTVSIENTPGEPISLQENADINVTLEWQAGDTETDFYIYRDGKLIGRTENMRFVDRLSIGTHEYTVINRLSDGNYSRSETLEATTAVEYIYLATADGLTEVNLRYRLKGSEEPKHTYAKESHLNRIAGRDYPTLTKSRFRDHTISCEAVILSREAELYERFERLATEPVVAKIRDGTCCTAVMESYGETAKKTYYRAYEFTLHEIDWEDFDDSQ